MSKLTSSRWLRTGCRLLLAGIFLYSGVAKVTDPLAFADSIATFRLLPSQAIGLLAVGLPPMEILLGVLLLSGWESERTGFVVCALFGIFLVAVAQGLARGLDMDCGCFGAGNHSRWSGWVTLFRDLLLLAPAWVIWQGGLSNHRGLSYGVAVGR